MGKLSPPGRAGADDGPLMIGEIGCLQRMLPNLKVRANLYYLLVSGGCKWFRIISDWDNVVIKLWINL